MDDNSVDRLLVRFLQQAGHDVRIPADAGLSGEGDAVHLTQAAREGRVSLSRNFRDFENLHNLVRQVEGRHPGMLIVRRMTIRDVT